VKYPKNLVETQRSQKSNKKEDPPYWERFVGGDEDAEEDGEEAQEASEA
jgi:hypothetical protein